MLHAGAASATNESQLLRTTTNESQLLRTATNESQLLRTTTNESQLLRTTTHESRLLRTTCSRSRRRYLQSGLSPYLQIPACPTNIRASVHASMPSARLLVGAFIIKSQRENTPLSGKTGGVFFSFSLLPFYCMGRGSVI